MLALILIYQEMGVNRMLLVSMTLIVTPVVAGIEYHTYRVVTKKNNKEKAH